MATNGGFIQFTRPATTQDEIIGMLPNDFWPDGQPNPSWVEDPLIYTSSEVAQEFLDVPKRSAERCNAMMELLDLGADMDAQPRPGEPGEQLLLIDIPIRRYVKSFV